MKRPWMLMILDGWGIAPEGPGNAVAAARTPNLDALFARYPSARLACSGLSVGLPEGQMGNSEVGHTNIGAGRVIYQELTRISREIETGGFFENPALLQAIDYAASNHGAVHLCGLLSDGGVHSHFDHMAALLQLCARKGAKVRVHGFMDGRDVSPVSGAGFVERLLELLRDNDNACLATLCGRYYAMDRDKRWERLEKAYAAMTRGVGTPCADPVAAVRASYDAGTTDEFLEPLICTPGAGVKKGDSLIFWNFRPDRAREITRAFVDPAFDGFDRPGGAILPYFVCFTQYDASMPNVDVAFKPQSIENGLGQYLADLGKTQLRIAETEKYAHVTFFLNGGVETQYPGEDRILVPSPKVATYDLAPDMSAVEVTEKCEAAIASGKYDLIVLNFANCDMVGHTGIGSAAVQAMETVDTCVGRLVTALEQAGGAALITADHGNAEQMLDPAGAPFTAHTTNPVPVLLTVEDAALGDGALCDLAPTLLELMGLPQPEEMTGRSLLVH